MKSHISITYTGITVAAWALVSGCSVGKDFGEDVRVPKAERQSFSRQLTNQSPLYLPKDEPLNVVDSQRRSEGQGKASSSANPVGHASCTADASQGGSAEAEFQLGHVLSYDRDTATSATVIFNVSYECHLSNFVPQLGAMPVGIKAYVTDSNRQTLGKVMLVGSDPEGLPEKWTGSQSPSFDVTLEPNTAYHLVVAGRVDVSGDEVPGPRASLHIKSMDIEVRPR